MDIRSLKAHSRSGTGTLNPFNVVDNRKSQCLSTFKLSYGRPGADGELFLASPQLNNAARKCLICINGELVKKTQFSEIPLTIPDRSLSRCLFPTALVERDSRSNQELCTEFRLSAYQNRSTLRPRRRHQHRVSCHAAPSAPVSEILQVQDRSAFWTLLK
jgi:hypothetical protein